MSRTNPPIPVAPGFTIREVVTAGYKIRYRAEAPDHTAEPLRKSENSAAADSARFYKRR